MRDNTGKKVEKHLFSGLLQSDTQTFRPQLLRMTCAEDYKELQVIIKNYKPILHNELESQIKNLLKIRRPKEDISEDGLELLYRDWCGENDHQKYGVYAYYPWSNRLVHMLDEKEFVELRTSRNKYKITEEEQKSLAQKKVGIIGLSVGQSVALTMALERTCGYLRLADFDTLELTNLNRLRTGVHNLGLRKTLVAAREIAEIDPFLKVELYHTGVTEANIDEFLAANGPIDLLVEECDSLPIKVLARKRARALQIPVLMDTSDRGMLDVERFDKEPKRDLLHGLVPNLDKLSLDEVSDEQKISILLKLVGGMSISSRLKASLVELNETVGSWPQLSSSVALGGAITADVARKVLLGNEIASGRYYVDLDNVFKEETKEHVIARPNEPSKEEMKAILAKAEINTAVALDKALAFEAVEHAAQAPSSGNDQPWLFYYHQGAIAVFHNLNRSYSFGDFQNLASYQSIGAAIENLALFLSTRNTRTLTEYFPLADHKALVALLTFEEAESGDRRARDLVQAIPRRTTNRKVCERQELPQDVLDEIQAHTEVIEGTELKWITDPEDLRKQGEIIAACDKIRVFNEWGHSDFFQREMRWTPEEAIERADGIDIRTLEIEPASMAAIRILSDYDAVKTLESIDGGNALNNVSIESASTASAFGLILRPVYSSEEFITGGRAWERMWLQATHLNLSIHPLIAPLYLFPRIKYGGEEALSQSATAKLHKLRKDFEELWGLPPGAEHAEVFLFKIFKTDHTPTKSIRLATEKVFIT